MKQIEIFEKPYIKYFSIYTQIIKSNREISYQMYCFSITFLLQNLDLKNNGSSDVLDLDIYRVCQNPDKSNNIFKQNVFNKKLNITKNLFT